MKKRFVFLAFIILTLSQKMHAQCLKDSVFHTDSLGTRTEKLFFPLTIRIGNDSIWVYNSANPRDEFMAFSIIEKQECKWDANLSEGFSNYKAAIKSKDKIQYPVIRVVYVPQSKRYIELLYPESEERILTIVK